MKDTALAAGPATMPAGDINDLICQCNRVFRGEIMALLEEGLDIPAIARRTNASRVCGGCAPLIGEIAGLPTMGPARLVMRERLDHLHARFLFRAERAEAVPVTPGAHATLQAVIGGRTLTRSYTITATADDGALCEFIVRREEQGVFSRWLHDYASEADVFRLSSPFGGDTAGTPAFTLFIAAGVGVTPVLTRLESLRQRPDARLHLHWSTRLTAESRLFDRVRELVADTPGATAAWRDTVQDGRIAPGDWRTLFPWSGEGVARICGPVTFMEDVAAGLKEAGWPEDRVIPESFVTGQQPARRYHVSAFDYRSEMVTVNSFHRQPGGDVLREARAFLSQFYHEKGASLPFTDRMDAVEREIAETGSYVHTTEELEYGAQLAWRNSTRCIGRFFWQTLQVRDLRNAQTEEEVFQACLDHIRIATNGGDLVSLITVCQPGRPGSPEIRILNPQLILYAGYRQPDGSVRGDPKNVALTELAQSLGWKGGGGRFDILPVVIRMGDRTPRLFEIPPELVLEVPLTHPSKPALDGLGLKWFALPAITSMALDIGGVVYSAAPLSGFYMCTEIANFNLADPGRYNQLPVVAEALGLPTGPDNPLWRDQALVDLNVAVLDSFRRAGVRILDHHSLADYFRRFTINETALNRRVYGHWPWIVPPMASNLMDIWHDPTLKNVIAKPNLFYQSNGLEEERLRPEGPHPGSGAH